MPSKQLLEKAERVHIPVNSVAMLTMLTCQHCVCASLAARGSLVSIFDHVDMSTLCVCLVGCTWIAGS